MKNVLIVSLILLSSCTTTNINDQNVKVDDSSSNEIAKEKAELAKERKDLEKEKRKLEKEKEDFEADMDEGEISIAPTEANLEDTKVSTAPTSPQAKAEYIKYEGGWFDIEYPSYFTAIGSIESSNTGYYDSAYFVSPDGNVSFYVYSPQWNGEPTDIALYPEEEKLASETSESFTKDGADIVIRRYTLEALNGSYLRSYEEIENLTYNTIRVIGIEYYSKADYDKHKAEYLHFKDSLVQYAD